MRSGLMYTPFGSSSFTQDPLLIKLKMQLTISLFIASMKLITVLAFSQTNLSMKLMLQLSLMDLAGCAIRSTSTGC